MKKSIQLLKINNMTDTKHFERLADAFDAQAKKYMEMAEKATEGANQLQWEMTKAEYKARADQLTNCARQLLKTCVKVAGKSKSS